MGKSLHFFNFNPKFVMTSLIRDKAQVIQETYLEWNMALCTEQLLILWEPRDQYVLSGTLPLCSVISSTDLTH